MYPHPASEPLLDDPKRTDMQAVEMYGVAGGWLPSAADYEELMPYVKDARERLEDPDGRRPRLPSLGESA